MTSGLKPPRAPWGAFPDVITHADETAVKTHPAYAAAKAGDFDAATALVTDTISLGAVTALALLANDRPVTLASARAFERDGVNAIPEGLADAIHEHMIPIHPNSGLGAVVARVTP